MEGSSHSYHRALHCLADFRTRSDEIRAHWFFPYFITAALRISSSVFFHTPPLIIILIFPSFLDLPSSLYGLGTLGFCRTQTDEEEVAVERQETATKRIKGPSHKPRHHNEWRKMTNEDYLPREGWGRRVREAAASGERRAREAERRRRRRRETNGKREIAARGREAARGEGGGL